jgi:hypothetical protein
VSVARPARGRAAREWRALLAAFLAALAAPAAPPASAAAQATAPDSARPAPRRASESQRVTGRVVRPHGENPLPVPGAWVVLHRIGHDSAGPIDSMRTDARGVYSFRYLRTDEDSALFIVSTVHGGVAYFTPPLRLGHVQGEAAEIMVFDTTSAPLPIRVEGRHLIIGSPAERGRRREVLEVYELSNDTTVTAVAPKNGRPVWTAIVPTGATAFRIGEGDVSEGGLVLRDGRVELFAPIAPGLKQISFRYELPQDAFPLSVPITGPVQVLEVMAEDPGARVSGAGLVEQRTVTSEGHTFKRYLAQEVPRNSVVRVDIPPDRGAARGVTVALLALFAAAMAGVLAAAIGRGRRRRPTVAAAAPAAVTAEPEPQALIRAIAELDVRFHRAAAEGTGERATYEAERNALKERLRAALARAKQTT